VKKPVPEGALTPLAWATSAFAAGVLLNADRVPPWVPVAALIFVCWRLAVAWRPARVLRLPGTAWRSVMALLLVGAVLVRFRTLNGLSAGTALLVLMGASKLLETRQRRDQYVVIGAGLFLLLAACLDRQGLLRAPLYLLHVWLCCAAIAVVSYGAVTTGANAAAMFDGHGAVRAAGRALLFAVPFAIVLFLFFPRLPGAFWSLPRTDSASTGLGDTMSPGSITDLTSSYDTAFRVRFEGSVPPPEELYWRGPVLHRFDGYTWSRTPPTFRRPKPLEYLGTPYRYRVSLEPSSQRWWLALDTPTAKPDAKAYFTDDYELVGVDPIAQTTTFSAVSYTRTRSSAAIDRYSLQRDTAWISGRNEKSQSFARQLRARTADDGAYVDAVLDFFRKGGFEYSLTPPPLAADSIDDFIFNTRRGFCGHFASAFVALMRAAGVPAHVVTGYLGGEWNPSGGYFIVRQSDAHAWAEVWLQGRGWTRIDPTAVVEPERLRRGILDLLPNAVSAPERLLHASPWLTQLFQRWDAANTWWNDHVLKFDFNAQLDILGHLGFDSPDLRTLSWAFAAGLVGWLGWIAWQIGRSTPPPRPDRLARAYSRLCGKMERAGVAREPYQGPLAYAATIRERRPDLENDVRALFEQYATLRYGRRSGETSVTDIAAFERRVAGLRVRQAA
jgi:transglutaminase-like putative cysteine protease